MCDYEVLEIRNAAGWQGTHPRTRTEQAVCRQFQQDGIVEFPDIESLSYLVRCRHDVKSGKQEEKKSFRDSLGERHAFDPSVQCRRLSCKAMLRGQVKECLISSHIQ